MKSIKKRIGWGALECFHLFTTFIFLLNWVVNAKGWYLLLCSIALRILFTYTPWNALFLPRYFCQWVEHSEDFHSMFVLVFDRCLIWVKRRLNYCDSITFSSYFYVVLTFVHCLLFCWLLVLFAHYLYCGHFRFSLFSF